ncbi:MAG: hypothetical protein WA110_10555 [Anaerolineaceae bacterium]
MSNTSSTNSSRAKQNDQLTGNLYAVIILIVVVIALVVAVVYIPGEQPQPQATPMVTALSTGIKTTPSSAYPAATQIVAAEAPVVEIDAIIIMGGILVLITLLAVFREVLWFRRRA